MATAVTGNARGGRSGGPQPQVEVADAGPDAVARAKRDIPTGPAYAGPVEQAPAAEPHAPDTGPEAVARAKRDLPTGPAYASAAEPTPTPPVKPQVVAALKQPDAATDATTDSAKPKFVAPLPPPRPANLLALALADAPVPPARPAELILASATEAGGGAFATASNKGFNPAVPEDGSLPKVITAGVDRAPASALGLAEGAAPIDDDSELLARAAELSAPLPSMPISHVGLTTVAGAPDEVGAIAGKTSASPANSGAAPQAHGWFVRTAALAAEDLGQWFGGVFHRDSPAVAPTSAKPATPPP